jgi:hypothetical protein
MAGDSETPTGADSNVDMDDLDTFNEDFYTKPEAPAKEPVTAEKETQEPEAADTEDEPLAPEDDENVSEDDDTEDEDEPKPESRKDRRERRQNRLQKRIDDLTARAREAERREAEALRRIAERTEDRSTPAPPTDIRQALPEGAPRPDAVNAAGQPLYPLGEFDPNFVTDLTNFNTEAKWNEIKTRDALERQQNEFKAAQQQLVNDWDAQLEDYEKNANPEIREDILDLAEEFDGIDPQYGDFLATTIMLSENGPAIMEYLSQNIGEARKIVASGPAAATRAIGRLEARLNKPERRERPVQTATPKVSEAPPPPTPTRGRTSTRSVRGDTDNLDAFDKAFYGQ